MWTKNFQTFKLDLEKAQEPQTKLPALDHRKSKGIPKKNLLRFIDYAKAIDCVDHNKLWKLLEEMGLSPACLSPASWETCMQDKKQQLELDME